jgi:hypothetical protein
MSITARSVEDGADAAGIDKHNANTTTPTSRLVLRIFLTPSE